MTQRKYTEIPNRQRCINKEHPYTSGARDIYDDEKEKSQEQINQEVDGAFENHQEQIDNKYNKNQVYTKEETDSSIAAKVIEEKERAEGVEGGLNTRLETVEQLAEISIEGGDAQIATASDFTNPDATKRAKIPTVGAIVDGLNDGIMIYYKGQDTTDPSNPVDIWVDALGRTIVENNNEE